MLEYSHLILTRFNLQYDSDSHIHLESSWLDNRFELFERYCLPSIECQTEPNFIWLILMDEKTPTAFCERMEKYCNRVPQLQVVCCPLCGNLNVWYREVAVSHSEGKEILITTRLDSDDRLDKDYVKAVQTYVNQFAQSLTPLTSISSDRFIPSILSFAYGKQEFVREKLSFRVRYVPNHYLTFVEHSADAITSLGRDHSMIQPDEITILDTEQPMWTEMVHGANICNGYCPAWTYYPHNREERIFLTLEWIRFRWRQILRHLPFVNANQMH